MGVAGCGKSTLGSGLAQALQLPFLEGDSYHSPDNVRKMRDGMALDDADRLGWLACLGSALQAHTSGAVLSCSALKHSYREQLRAAVTPLYFVHPQITPELAQLRVSARASDHMFPASLVQSQFATLQDPHAEPGVLQLDASLDNAALCRHAVAWMAQQTALRGRIPSL